MPFQFANRQSSIANRKRKNIPDEPLTINYKRAFTLIELLVVIAIIGVLATLGTFTYTDSQKKSRDTRRKSDLAAIQKALELTKQDTAGNYSYPYIATPAALTSSNTTPAVASTYIKAVPTDPKTGTGYMYTPLLSTGGAACTGTGACTAYTLYTCLENIKDTQKDARDGDPGGLDLCGGVTANGLVSYTISNL